MYKAGVLRSPSSEEHVSAEGRRSGLWKADRIKNGLFSAGDGARVTRDFIFTVSPPEQSSLRRRCLRGGTDEARSRGGGRVGIFDGGWTFGKEREWFKGGGGELKP